MNSPGLQSQILRNIVRAQLAQGKLDAAERTAREAMRAARRASGSEEPAMLSAAAQLAFQRGRLAQAQALIDRSFAGIALEKTTMPMREAHATAHRIYRAVGNAPEALAHLDALKRLDDKATKLATQTSNALMGARFDFANQELRIERLKAEELRRTVKFEQERARNQLLLFAGAGAAALVVLALLSLGLFTIRRSRDAVRAANDDLAVTNSALTEALTVKTEFLATTSHEIRTPLNGILGMTEVMLVDRSLPDDARERVRLVHGAGKTMRALIDDILDAAKIEKGKLSLEHAPFDLTELLNDAAGLWEDQMRAKGLAFETALDLPARPVVGDATRLRQILLNLLSNAVKFTETGSIRLSAAGDGERYRIAVSDTGVGIAAGKLETVFESFRQADASTTRRFGGTGLGLSISRGLARAMGGELAVASGPDAGSTFTLTVTLPDHIEEPARPAAGEAVLVADRNPIMRAMLRNLISPHTGRVLTAASADEALAAMRTDTVKALLLDENMLDDAEIALVVASAHRCGALIMLLRSPGTGDHPATSNGTVQVIEKPVTGPELLAVMFSGSIDHYNMDPLVSRAA